MLTMEDLDRFREGHFGYLGFYVYLKFLKNVETEPPDVQIDPKAILNRTMRPIVFRFSFLNEKTEGYIKGGLSLRDALEKVACNIDSLEDKEIFEVFKKETIVKDGLKGMDPVWENLTPAQKKEFLKTNPSDLLAIMDFHYNLLTGPGTTGVHHKKKPGRPKNKKKGRK